MFKAIQYYVPSGYCSTELFHLYSSNYQSLGCKYELQSYTIRTSIYMTYLTNHQNTLTRAVHT